MKCGLRVVAWSVVLWALIALPGYGWGRKGHRVAGAVADGRLTPAARTAIAELLAYDGSIEEKTVAGISFWADEVGRRTRRESGPWHYVNVPITETAYRPEFCGASPECIISRIQEFRSVLSDRDAPRAQRREALLFLVHLVEDLHMPLHVGDNHDRGGNSTQVRFQGRGTNLHRLWDTDLIESVERDEAAWARRLSDLADEATHADWANGDVIDWANESLAIARVAYRQPESDALIKPGTRLDALYTVRSLPDIERRLAQAGVRLATILNAVFADPGPTAPSRP